MTTEGRPGVLGRKWCYYRGKTWSSGLGYGRKRRGELGSRESLRLRYLSRPVGQLSLASPLLFERVRECSSRPCGIACHSSTHTMSDFGKVAFPLGICLLICKMRVWHIWLHCARHLRHLSLHCKHDVLLTLFDNISIPGEILFSNKRLIRRKINNIELLLFSRFCAMQCPYIILLNYPSKVPLVSIEFDWSNRKSNSLWFRAIKCIYIYLYKTKNLEAVACWPWLSGSDMSGKTYIYLSGLSFMATGGLLQFQLSPLWRWDIGRGSAPGVSFSPFFFFIKGEYCCSPSFTKENSKAYNTEPLSKHSQHDSSWDPLGSSSFLFWSQNNLLYLCRWLIPSGGLCLLVKSSIRASWWLEGSPHWGVASWFILCAEIRPPYSWWQ